MNSVVEEGIKVCTRCGETKALNQFHKNKNNKDGLVYFCRSCQKIREAAYLQQSDKYLHKTIGQTVSNACHRAKVRNQPFDSDFFNYDFVASIFRNQGQMCCPLCFGSFAARRLTQSKKSFEQNSLSFDCVIPERGYTRGNVMVICYSCNAKKSNSSPDWFRRVMDAIESRMEIIYRMPCIDPPGCTP